MWSSSSVTGFFASRRARPHADAIAERRLHPRSGAASRVGEPEHAKEARRGMTEELVEHLALLRGIGEREARAMDELVGSPLDDRLELRVRRHPRRG
jgi:hypothetical protein